MGMTFAQKVLARKAGLKRVDVGQIVEVEPDFNMSHDNTSAIAKTFAKIGVEKVKNPERFVIVLDHTVPAATDKYAQNHKEVRQFVEKQGIPHFFDIGVGICHQVLVEKGFALPGKLILGSDSHTTTYGAMGALAAGVGRSEMAVLYATSGIWLKTPSTFRFLLSGALHGAVSSKDLVLRIIGDIGADGALYRSVEFTGDGIGGLSIGDRMVLCNMAAEMGAKNGYVPPDDRTIEYLRNRAVTGFETVYSDPDAEFEKTMTWDLSTLEPQVAAPHTVDHVKGISQVQGIPVNQCLLGTCTNGRLEDLQQAARVLKGHRVHPKTRLLIFPASRDVLLSAMADGTIPTLVEAGAVLMSPGCGPCLGAHEGVLAPGEKCISTANRNFKGRMGASDAEVFLGSPATVAASAIEGVIADPRRYWK